jgi:ATP-dependent helicase HrpB
LWDAPQTASLEAASRPEILAADLSSLVLDLAHWGALDPAALDFLDPPPPAALAEARALLAELGAIDAQGRITEEGRRLRALPLPPRLARMVIDAADAWQAPRAADIAVLLTERGLGGNDVDLAHRLDALARDRSQRARQARGVAERWADLAQAPRGKAAQGGRLSIGAILARAYPDRIAKNRGAEGSFLLANGRGARLDPASPLSREPYLAVAEISGSAAQGRIVLAAALTLPDIEAQCAARIETREDIVFDPASAGLRARRLRRLGALTLNEQPMTITPSDDSARLLAQGILHSGLAALPWTKALSQCRGRVKFLRGSGDESWPDLSDAALTQDGDWLLPATAGKTALSQLSSDDLAQALMALLPWKLRRELDAAAPTHFVAPSGSAVAIDYEAEGGPRLSIRVQELFGLDHHPTVAGGRVPLTIELLSPAQRPVQVTRDLPGFWRGSYAAVKAEMKGRYPRHPWPDDPLAAPATRKAKPRGR